MKLVASLVLFAALLSGCGTSNKLIHATAPTKEQSGMSANVKGAGGPISGSLDLTNVGGYTSIPSGWQGPVPPGWTRPDVPPATPPQPPPP